MLKTKKEINNEIEADIKSVKLELKNSVNEVFKLKKELKSLENALTCEHNWVPFTGKIFSCIECTKCGYMRDE